MSVADIKTKIEQTQKKDEYSKTDPLFLNSIIENPEKLKTVSIATFCKTILPFLPSDLPEGKRNKMIRYPKAWDLSDFDGMTLRDFCKLSLFNSDPTGLQMIFNSFFQHTLLIDQMGESTALSKNPTSYNARLENFYSGISFSELQDPKIADPYFFQSMLRYSTIHAIQDLFTSQPPFFKELSAYLAENLFMPSCLIQPLDLSAVYALSLFENSGLDKKSMEGHWIERDEAIYTYAESGVNKTQLRSFILQKRPKEDNAWRYPVPNENPWPQQKELLQCLDLIPLRFKANNLPGYLKVISKAYKIELKTLNDIFENSIYTVLKNQCGSNGSAPARLPLPGKKKNAAGSEYIVIPLRNGKKLQYTEAFPWYVEAYNIAPSIGFLDDVKEFLKTCREVYAKADAEYRLLLQDHIKDKDRKTVAPAIPTVAPVIFQAPLQMQAITVTNTAAAAATTAAAAPAMPIANGNMGSSALKK